MQKLLLIRPGATEYDRQGRILGTIDMPLSDDGRRQVASSLDAIRAESPVAVYTSPCQSATETAGVIGEALDLRVKTLDKLVNLDHGLWQGMLVEDVRSKQPKVYRQWQEQPETVCPPEGETVMEAMQRVAAVLKKMVRKHRDDTVVALVAPEPLASVVRHVVRQDALGDLWKSAEVCGQWEAIEVPAALAGVS
ncbi:MAG: histidine phosphatase family protein [Planctomycetota bacterium]